MARRLQMVAAITSFAALAALPSAALGSERSQTRTTLRRIVEVLEAHHAATGERPRTLQDLGVVLRMRAPRIAQSGGAPVDAWGSRFVYESDEQGYRVASLGENRRDEGGAGDDLVARGPAGTAGAGGPAEDPRLRRIQSLFPVAVLVALAPFAWAAVRRARRDLR